MSLKNWAMRSNYKKLGTYIKQVDIRNTNNTVTYLRGVSSVYKSLIQSKANVIGADMTRYKLVSKNQFVFNPNTARMGDKIPIALNDSDDCIVSQIYPVFDIIDHEVLSPEYLIMWFKRPEFDRYARFKSHGSAREIFDWNEMCETELPIPHIDKQREIVKEYMVLVDRINLNNQLIQKLEETAQAIYKQWFVDFEFPDENGKPYKSNGGEMEFNEELEKDIPKEWEVATVKDFCGDMKSGGTPSRNNISYWNSNDIPWIKTGEIHNNILISAEEYISKEGLKNSSAKLLPNDTVLMSMYGVNAGDIGILKFRASVNQACCGMICENQEHSAYLYFHFLHNQKFISSQSIGGAQENLSKDFIERIKLLKPNNQLLERKDLKIIIDNKEILTRKLSVLSALVSLVLSKLATIEN